MSKIFISTILAICAVAVASAQTAATTDSAQYGIIVKERFEGELFGGMALPIGEAEYGTKKMGWNVGGEVRYNITKLPMDIGLQYSHVTTSASMTTYNQNSLKVTGDWNFYLPSIPKLTPFAGAGVGAYWCDSGMGITAMPRVGVEYGDFIRLTFATQFTRRYYNNAQVSIGLVLGGRKDYQREYRNIQTINAADPHINYEPKQVYNVQARELYRLTVERQRFKRRGTTYGILGGVSLGAGAFLLTNGIVGLANNHNGNPNTVFFGVIFTGTGGLLTLGSIPLFIACHHQRVHAAEVSTKIDLLTTTTHSSPTPAVGLLLKF